MYIQTISAHTSQRTQFASIKSDESANAAQENNGCLSCESYGAYAMCKQNSDYLVLNLSCVQRLGQHRTEWDISEPQTAFFIVELLSRERTTLYLHSDRRCRPLSTAQCCKRDSALPLQKWLTKRKQLQTTQDTTASSQSTIVTLQFETGIL